jgi:hypothetical protein
MKRQRTTESVDRFARRASDYRFCAPLLPADRYGLLRAGAKGFLLLMAAVALFGAAYQATGWVLRLIWGKH